MCDESEENRRSEKDVFGSQHQDLDSHSPILYRDGYDVTCQRAVNMAAEEDTDTLKTYWDHFFKSETGTYEKSTWLDLFLAEFIIRINNGANPKELIKFCPVSGVVTLVGCELLCGIHRVTSSINTHYTAPLPCLEAPCSGKQTISSPEAGATSEESRVQPTSLFTRTNAMSSAEILKKYLLGGVAWRCLVLLKALGVEGLSCCRQLSSVLIWLFGELSGAGDSASRPSTPASRHAAADAPRTPIHQLFSHKIWSKQKPTNTQGTKVNSAASSDRGSVTGRSRHFTQLKSDNSENKIKRKSSKHTDQSSDSGDSNDDLQILNRSLTIKVCTPNDDFEYFNSPMRSPSDLPNETLYSDPYYTPRKVKPKADDYMNDKHREIINSEITTFEFTIIITDLLQELCKAESSLSGSEGSQISVQCINFSLRNLCSLQFGSLPVQSAQCDSQEISRIKVALTELLIVSLDKVLIHADLCAKLINNGILPMLLRILEDVICKSSSKYHTKSEGQHCAKENEISDKTESENMLKFVFGIAYSITAFFHCLLMQCRSVEKLREFTDQFRLYGECLKGGLLKECIELMIRIPGIGEEEPVILIKKLIESIGKLVSGMKRVRSELIHSAACPRTRHKVCRQRVTAGMHHHHDILGEASTGLPMSSACCVSVLYGTLTALVADEEVSAQNMLRNKILRVMLNCGVCCCFSPGLLMESIVRLMLTHNGVASLCLQVLEHTVYGELGASVLIPKAVTDQLPCSICEPCDERKDMGKKYCPHGVNQIERKSVWSFLIHYNSLLQLDNHNNVLHATVSHLLRVTPKCRMEMKYELLFSVIYPTFIVAKHRYIIRLEEAAYFLTVSCLNIFTSLLNTVSFAEQFIQKGGLSYVLELVSLSEFSNQCCSILEIAIIVEIFKLIKENSEMTYFREMGSLASVQMLFKSLSDMTDKCFKIYKLKLPDEKYEQLCDVTKEREMLAIAASTRGTEYGQVRKLSAPKAIKPGFGSGFASSENVTDESIEDHIEILKNVCTFWKTCAGLCLYSPMFREYIASEMVFLDSYALLKVLLYYLCNCECGMTEMRVLVKIMEALLTVQFAVSDVTSGRSKETSGALVRQALSGPARALEVGGGGGLRSLCEALIRVATARPSDTHLMPRLSHAKVPPLLCPSGSTSAECSSSEDSTVGPYASEHSECYSPYSIRPDEGYEADVEIGKLDASSMYKARKLSESLSTISAMSGQQIPPAVDGLSVECSDYMRNGELAHPELCVIVVDILTQLIHKLLNCTDKSEASQANTQRVCSTLARACCGRLAAALARARPAPSLAPPSAPAPPPPPALLHRLLAPAQAALLARTDPYLADLQRSILELIHVVAAQSMEASELGLFLRLFVWERPPLAMLLPALLRLVDCSTPGPNTPDCILTFPVDGTDTMQNLVEDLNYVVISNSSQSQHAESFARKLQEAHTRAGITSCWSMSAVRAGAEGAGWGAWLGGFSLLLWLRTHTNNAQPHSPPHSPHTEDWDGVDDWQHESSDSESIKPSPKKEGPIRPSEPAHVFSIGHESLMFEIWLDTATGTLTFRLTRPEANCERVVSEARVLSALPPRHWACLALNVAETVIKRRIHIQVTLFVNGYEYDPVLLPVQGILVRKVLPTSVLVGHVGTGTGAGVGAYHMCSAQVYRAPLLTRYTALHLTAHGPDHSCQVRCEAPNYTNIITPTVLDSNIDWDQVFEISSAVLRELHDNVLLTFSARAPTIMNLYHQTVAMPTVFGGRVSSSSGSGGGGGSVSSIPEALYCNWRAPPRASARRALPSALYTLGGPELLLYLYARVVELEGTEEEQATALSIFLRACRLDNRLYSMLYEEELLDMVHTVLASPRCVVSQHLLRVVLEEACSVSPLSLGGGTAVLTARGVVLQPALLLLLVRAVSALRVSPELQWEVESGCGSRQRRSGTVWALALAALCQLLHDTHPRRAFNHYQLSRVDLLRHLLLACKERFLNSECGPLEQEASERLVELVRALVGVAPDLHSIALLNDFLLLMHQASDTFVTHSRANFYFLLTPETQEMSEFMSSFKRKPSRRSKKRPPTIEQPTPTPMTTPTSTSMEDMANDNSLNVLKEMALDADKDVTDSSVESTKQMKGIINKQIKEGRIHNRSSTSENSDATADVDDVQHTTVEMYSSGIYHQSRVRAGAAPGWSACEGLLLLLRDTVAVLPDHLLAQAVCGAVQAERLVVLGHHREAGVRAAAVRALAALQRRAPAPLARRLLHMHYYTHLANQISLYPGSWELATACAALITKCDVPLEDQLEDDIWMDVPEESVQRSGPLLALLPTTLHNVPLAHNITLLVRRIIDKASLKLLNEVAVAEVVVRSIRGVGQIEDTSFEGRELLLEDLFELLNRIAIKALSTQHSMQIIIELHHMVTYVEMCAERNGEETVRAVARDAQLTLFTAQLDYLEERLHSSYTAHTNYASYFTTVLSSAVLGGEGALRAERTELATRHHGTVVRAVSFLLTRSPSHSLHAEAPLACRLLDTLLIAVSGSGGSRPKWWVGGGLAWTAPLQELVWWAAGARRLHAPLLRRLYSAPQPALHLLTPQDPAACRKLAVYLVAMLKHAHGAAEAGGGPGAQDEGSESTGVEESIELAVTAWARGWALSVQAGLPERLHGDALLHEAQALLAADEERWAKAAHRMRQPIAKVVFSKDSLASKVTETAMGMTRQVVDAQNGERKAFMEHLRRAHSDAAAAAQRWRRLVDTHTHEQGVWHESRSYPCSWELDPTEGPGRVRVRLRRAHLQVPPRLLHEGRRAGLQRARTPPPLHHVLAAPAAGALRGGLVARLHLNETVAYMARATYVTVARELEGELLLSDRCIHFVPEEGPWEGGGDEESGGGGGCQEACAQSWSLESVVQVATRRWCLQERALELFLSSGHAHLLAFADQNHRAAFLVALNAAHLPARMEADSLNEAMNQWRNGTITNWEYLMRLNGLGGRTYNDLMQYPVLPFVIADYTSRILDLNDPASFRDLSKPMAVQNKNREQHYINTYNDLKLARREGCSPLLSRQPHHYASLYSNSGGVLHYLVRLPPFTQLFLNYQDNNFDMPDRTFHSLATTWRLITNDSPTDVKELIPELFYLPELFHNNEGLNLGVRQCGLGVESVELPPWAADARLFTLAHRQALEAPHVTERLPHWIDLVFGYKQTGQAAIDAINVFPACTYYGFDPCALEDEVDRTAAAAMVRTYGQAPRQLLRAPHPHRAPDLQHNAPQGSVWSGVEGARWGRYCGSPGQGAAAPVCRRLCAGAAALHALPHARSVAVATRNTALFALNGGVGAGSGSSTSASGGSGGQGWSGALVSWGHSDNVLRLKRRRDAAPDMLLYLPHPHQITKVASSCAPGGCPYPVFIGQSSGRVMCMRVRGDASAPPRLRTRYLHAHSAAITDIFVCVRAALLVTASIDGKIVLWDLNSLSYIRTLPNRDSLSVTHVTISETLCDVASVHDAATRVPSAESTPTRDPDANSDATDTGVPTHDHDADSYEKDAAEKYKSLIRVHTVNASFVGSVKVAERVTCVCYSNAPEGVSVNCLAVGLSSGGVALYSSWDLRRVAYIPPLDKERVRPLLSITYSSDSQLLFGCYSDGVVSAWESGAARAGSVRIVPAHALC